MPPDKLYPLDLDRAFKQLDQIKPHVAVWWTGGAQTHAAAARAARSTCIPTWNARAAGRDRRRRAGQDRLEPGPLLVEGWAIPKGSPKADLAAQFVAFLCDAEAPGRLHAETSPTARRIPNAYEFIDKPSAAKSADVPENFTEECHRRRRLGRANQDKATERFKAWMLT